MNVSLIGAAAVAHAPPTHDLLTAVAIGHVRGILLVLVAATKTMLVAAMIVPETEIVTMTVTVTMNAVGDTAQAHPVGDLSRRPVTVTAMTAVTDTAAGAATETIVVVTIGIAEMMIEGEFLAATTTDRLCTSLILA
jgi:hypothetical protein